ncbi:hypothetical protein [Massilia psychrophila]|uniref:Uncharacterized protein n=1 Tax=Massilia psychrophila TaxID=1603353 RepID=A0A2G8SZJ4_9BURK|nr:hypothetical protein [Massilia psychrophila]PIL39199.1 hypothetical protein CR103_14015 [Massilia psychrophila]GGE82108.1 hypothetical protein GCM10008020_28790 [Massilia psychrophila]
MILRSVIFTVTLLLANSSANAQYASVVESEAARKSSEEVKVDAARAALLNAQFWVVPNPKASSRLTFREGLKGGSDAEFVLTEPSTFKVVGFAPDEYKIYHYVLIEFPDGKRAYLAESNSFDDGSKKNDLFADIYTPGKPRYDFIEYILTASPEDVRLAEKTMRTKATAAATAWKARGGVSIGMTPGQVRASNWGKPDKINRSTGSYGVHEQWVYGSNSYIYLENGFVRSIQN